MTAVAHIALRSLLVALTFVTALGLGVARGQPAVAGHVVFCGSQGVSLVAVDASGAPIEAPGHCPDCAGLLSVPVPTDPSGQMALERALGVLSAPVVAGAAPVVAVCAVPPARAPPMGTAG